MKKIKSVIVITAIAVVGCLAIAADHIDAPAVKGGTSDITDFYAFQGEDTNNIVFMANVQGLLSPSATSSANFDENVLVEINIDTNGDAVEDLVIQAVTKNKKMYFIGPFAPSEPGLISTLTSNIGNMGNSVKITPYGSDPIIYTNKEGMKFFAGPRDDPFYFDFGQYSAILKGEAPGGFVNPGTDTFAGTNVLSIVVEVPKYMLGTSSSINAWVESKRKQ